MCLRAAETRHPQQKDVGQLNEKYSESRLIEPLLCTGSGAVSSRRGEGRRNEG